MGLDMYLEGRKFLWNFSDADAEYEEGYRLSGKTYDLGYWRKHGDLHDLIVRDITDGVDNCEDVDITQDDLIKLISTLKDDPKHDEDVAIFTKALFWLQNREDHCYRSVVYRASW